MIKFLQSGNKAAKYILAGFLLILAASMVVYLIPNFMSDAGSTNGVAVVATVGGHEIRSDEVVKLVQAQLQRQGISGSVPPQYLGFFSQQAVQQLIQQAEIS